MKTVTKEEFGLHAADLLRGLSDGEPVQIVDEGRSVGRLVPDPDSVPPTLTRKEAEARWREIIAFRDSLPATITRAEMTEWRREGLRY